MLVNGLGATKYEELFVLFGEVAELLEAAGVVLVQPEVGELVTSLDMAGCSLSVTWLDEELEGYWVAPADTPAFRRGTAVHERALHRASRGRRATSTETASVEASDESRGRRRGGPPGRRRVLHATVEENKDYLGRIDAIAGDGDHGIGMSRGSKAAAEAADETEGGVQTVLAAAGAAFGDKAGGTSGILWGLLLDGIGKALGNTEKVTAATRRRRVEKSATDLQTLQQGQPR